MDEHIYPAEADYTAELQANTAAGKRWSALNTIENLKPKAQPQACGICFCRWTAPPPQATQAQASTNQEYAPLAEIMGRAMGQRSVQLLGTRHRQHGNHCPLRQ